MAVTADIIETIAYFRGLGRSELDAIGRLVFEKETDRGKVIQLDGEPVEELYFVISGVVKLMKTSADGKEQIFKIVRPGESFGDVPALDGQPSYVSAQAMTPVGLYGIKSEDMAMLIRDYPQVASNAIGVLSAETRHLASLVEELSFKQVISRLAGILLNPGDGSRTLPRLTQQDMAAMAGTAREMIGRSLKALEEDGVIKLDRHRIIINDKEALKEIAKV